MAKFYNELKLVKEVKSKPPVIPKPIDTSFYDNQTKAYEEKMRADAAIAKAEAEQQYGDTLRQAYVSNMQNDRKMQDRLSEAGIRGGGSETANLGLMTGYQNSRNKINSEKQSAIRGIDKSADDSIFNFTTTTNAAKNEYVEQIKAEKRQIAEQKRKEAVEKSRIKADRAYQDKVRRQQQKQKNKETKKTDKKAAYEARYSKYFDVKSLEKALKKAKGLERTIINARIGYLKAKKEKKKK